jgi:hypothetical protein
MLEWEKIWFSAWPTRSDGQVQFLNPLSNAERTAKTAATLLSRYRPDLVATARLAWRTESAAIIRACLPNMPAA